MNWAHIDLTNADELDAETLGALEDLAHIGCLTLGLIAAMDRTGHVTLRGHVRYQHAVHGDPLANEFVHWIKQITNSEPHDSSQFEGLVDLARRYWVAASDERFSTGSAA